MDDPESKYDIPASEEDGNYTQPGSSPLDAASGALDIIKPHLGKIIAIIVVAVIVYFSYTYFVGSVKNVTISVSNTEGDSLSGADVRIFLQQDGKSEQVDRFTGSSTVQLRTGEYIAKVSASGYKATQKYFEVLFEDSDSDVSVELSKNIDVELSVDFPESAVAGQDLTVMLNITNKSNSAAEIELVFEGDLDDEYLTIDVPPVIVLQPQYPAAVTLEITVNSDLSSSQTDKELNGKIRVKYTNISASVEYTIIEFKDNDVKVTPTNFDFATITAGKDIERKPIRITNENKFTMEDVTITIEDVISNNNSTEEIAAWFSFTRNPLDVPYGKNGETTTMILTVPVTAKGDSVSGTVHIETDYWSKNYPFEVDVEAAEVKLEAEGIEDKYTLSKTGGTYESEDDEITLRNRGDVDLKNVSVNIDPTQCDSSWIDVSPNDLGTIAAGSNKKITIIVRAPSMTAAGHNQVCDLHILFDDPTDPVSGDRQDMVVPIKIETE